MCWWQGCSLGLDVSVSRRSFQTSRSRGNVGRSRSRSRLGLKIKRLGLVSVSYHRVSFTSQCAQLFASLQNCTTSYFECEASILFTDSQDYLFNLWQFKCMRLWVTGTVLLANIVCFMLSPVRLSVCNARTLLSRLKFLAMFLRLLVPWPSVDIRGKFYGDRPRGNPSVGGIELKRVGQI